MPTNQQRRDAAKRKLARQLQRREEQDRARRQRLVIIGVIAAVLVISGGVWFFTTRDSADNTASDATSSTDAAASTEPTTPATPCSYPASGTAAKAGQPAHEPGAVELRHGATSTIVLNGQDVPVSLDRALAPCGVNSFLSLASQGFYDNTDCHRLTASEQLNILQCGDPTRQGQRRSRVQLRHRGRHGRHLPGRAPSRWPTPARTPTARSSSSSTAPPPCRPEYTILGTVTGRRHERRQRRRRPGSAEGRAGRPTGRAPRPSRKVTVPERRPGGHRHLRDGQPLRPPTPADTGCRHRVGRHRRRGHRAADADTGHQPTDAADPDACTSPPRGAG